MTASDDNRHMNISVKQRECPLCQISTC